MKVKPNVIAIFDGQTGSCGKGKVIGQYAQNPNVNVAISNNMPNSGHTYEENGKRRVFRTLPVSSVNPRTKLFLGSGTIINMDVLEQEYNLHKDLFEGREIIAHPQIPLIEPRHIAKEKELIKSGTTYSGCGACRAEYVMRDPNLKFFKGYKSIKVDPNYHETLMNALKDAKLAILEGSQGNDLDLLHSGHYPYVTSRSTSVASMCDYAEITPTLVKERIMIIRPYPIRISNDSVIGTKINTGPCGTAKEWTWETINIAAYLGIPPEMVSDSDIQEYQDICPDLTEYTTVTKKVRRIFNIDPQKLRHNCSINQPTSIYLNFFEYLDVTYQNYHGIYDGYNDIYIEHYLREYLSYLEDVTSTPITMLGTGPDVKDYIDCRPYYRKLARDLKQRQPK